MKYIRTEDRIYEVEKKGIGKVYYCKGFLGKTRIVQEFNVIDKANTIEELCDYFLIDKNDIEEYEPTTIIIFDDYDDFRYSMMCKDNASGYGCIKTDKGLIYVAKMDNDGKLVLI